MKKFILASLTVSALALGSVGVMADGQDTPVMGDTSVGKTWVNSKGMTLYTYDKDEAGKSTCIEDCAKTWSPMMASKDAKPEGKWTVIKREDGNAMWAYDGHPIYLYGHDANPGDVTGNNIDGFHVAQ